MNQKRNDRSGIAGVLIYPTLLLLVIFAVWLFWRENPSGTAFDVVTASLEKSGFMDDMEPQLSEDGLMLLGLSEDDCMGFYYASTAKNGDACEVFVVQTEDDRSSSRVLQALNERLERQTAYFETDDEEQTALLKNAVIKRQGTYILYAVSEDALSLENKFLDSMN